MSIIVALFMRSFAHDKRRIFDKIRRSDESILGESNLRGKRGAGALPVLFVPSPVLIRGSLILARLLIQKDIGGFSRRMADHLSELHFQENCNSRFMKTFIQEFAERPFANLDNSN